MSNRRGWSLFATNILVVVILVSACRNRPDQVGQASEVTPTNAAPALASVEEESVSAEGTRITGETGFEEITPDPLSVENIAKELVICIGQEPESLYPYSEPRISSASNHVLQGIYESMFTTLSYEYQARGIEKMPSLADGDAAINPVTVEEGDKVMDADGDVIILREGARVKDASGKVVEFEGDPISMSQIVVNFNLKPLVWSDGTPVTAGDSVFSFELAADPQTPIPKKPIEQTASYKETGELTLEWKGIPGNLDPNYFANIWTPYPRHYWSQYSAGDLLEAEEAKRMPLSHGPFVVEEWLDGDHLTLVKNENYYLSDQELPRVDRIRFLFTPTSGQMSAQLLSGECDIGTHDGLTIRESSLLLDAERNGLLRTYFQAGPVFEHIDFGINPIDEFKTTRPDWFEDPRVRQAIVMCTDRQRMVEELLFEKAEVMDAYIPSLHPLIPDDLTVWPYDVEAANILLDAAGFLDADGDGIREDQTGGTPFKVTLLGAKGNELSEEVAGIFQENMAECGIEIELSYLLPDKYFADGPEGLLFGRQFDLAAFSWLMSIEPNCALYLSSQIPNPSNNWNGNYNNVTGFRNSEFDTACEAALEALPGTSEFEENHQEALRIWSEQMPIIPLFMHLKVAATRSEVENFIVDPTQDSELWNLYNIDIISED